MSLLHPTDNPENPPALRVDNPLASAATLRDAFACAALPAYIAKIEAGNFYLEDAATQSFAAADAMLRARGQR